MLYVDTLEAFWFLLNAGTLVFTLGALIEARRDQLAARGDTDSTGDARRLTARGNLRREALRTVVQLLLLSIVIPGLFSARPIMLTPPLVALILVPIVLFTSTVFDARDRGRLADMLLAAIRSERFALALESSVQEGNQLTREGIAASKAAQEEANHANRKLATLTEALGHKEDKP
jgi:hypothetical protein